MVEALERRKESLIIGVWANEGLNDDKGTRANAITDIEENFDEAVRMVLSGSTAREDEEEIDPDNPFFRQMYEGMDRLHTAKPTPDLDPATVEAVIEQEQDFSRYIDQN